MADAAPLSNAQGTAALTAVPRTRTEGAAILGPHPRASELGELHLGRQWNCERRDNAPRAPNSPCPAGPARECIPPARCRRPCRQPPPGRRGEWPPKLRRLLARAQALTPTRADRPEAP